MKVTNYRRIRFLFTYAPVFQPMVANQYCLSAQQSPDNLTLNILWNEKHGWRCVEGYLGEGDIRNAGAKLDTSDLHSHPTSDLHSHPTFQITLFTLAPPNSNIDFFLHKDIYKFQDTTKIHKLNIPEPVFQRDVFIILFQIKALKGSNVTHICHSLRQNCGSWGKKVIFLSGMFLKRKKKPTIEL